MAQKRILVVDDNVGDCYLINDALRKNNKFVIISASNAKECMNRLAHDDIDLIVLDYLLPDTNGLELMKKIKKKGHNLPIIMVTGQGNEQVAVQAMKMEACDYLVKSPDLTWQTILPVIVTKCIKNHETLKRKKELEEILHKDFLDTISTLAALIEIKDPYTGGHSRTVRDLSLAIANKLKLPRKEKEAIEVAAFLHDIGKIGIPGKVLNKANSLSPKEYAHVQKHVELGSVALKRVRKMQLVCNIIKHHHEAYNGQGYPDGLKGEQIPLGSRIIHLADAYSAMTSDRPYRSAIPKPEVIAELKREKGKDFDPKLVEIFLRLLTKHKDTVPDRKIEPDEQFKKYMN